MTKIKLCGLRRIEDIKAVNLLLPDYIGFVFAKKSKRYISYDEAFELKKTLDNRIKAVGVFVNEDKETVAKFLENDIIDYAQLHGNEDEEYIKELRILSNKPIIQACRVRNSEDLEKAQMSSADLILLDAGAGDGKTFDWKLLNSFKRPYFLAGGLDTENVSYALTELHPYGVDVSSGIETDGYKDLSKMKLFVDKVRELQIGE